MCGVAGYFGTAVIDEKRLNDCASLMRRRGPDYAARKHWVNPAGRQVYLLHSRLSIIDLDPRSHQPFQRGPQWLAFNGELYNYVEVRDRLKAQGESFGTSSDTEVMLAAWQRDGARALDAWEGMWSFALYDEQDGSLTLCRDRFGEKPFFIYQDAGGTYFGSEAKFIFALLGRKLPVNVSQVCRYLVNGYKALYKTPDKFFEGLRELPPAGLMRLDKEGKQSSQTYWQPRFSPREDMTYEEAVAGARQELIRAVGWRLRADVPLAFCLSGGVDSTALVGIAKNVFNQDVHGFTIENSDPRYEEKEMVDHAVASWGLRHTALPVDPAGFLEKMRALVNYHDAPVFTITYYAQWLLMGSIASHGYKISMSGTAADEIFSGYYDHHLAYLYEIRGDKALSAASKAAWEKHIKPWVRNPFLSDPELFVRDPQFRGHIYLNAEDFEAYLKRAWHEPFNESRYTDSLLRNRMMNELFHEAVPIILHEDDLNAMYFSVENRSPYLDRGLFDFCYQIPSRHLVRDGRAKSVLRDAVQGLVPDKVRLNPRKVGFNAPIFSFLDVKDPAVVSWLLGDSPIYEHVRRERIQQLIARLDLPNSESKFLFSFVSAKLFLEGFA